MSLIPNRGHPQQLTHRDRALPRLPGMELPDVPYDVDDRATAPEDFDRFQQRFHFTIDVAASAHNAKCERFFSVEDDGLAQPWAGERVWCNPPYSNVRPWVQKAWREHRAELVVMLVPANRTEQGWWQQLVEPYRDMAGVGLRVEFLPGRMRFIAPGADRIGPNERPPFGCCLLIWNVLPDHGPGAAQRPLVGF